MRTPMRVIVCTCLFFFSSFSVSWSQEAPADLFVGVWELVEMPDASGSMVKVHPGNYKIFGADGSYHFMRALPQGSCFVQEGTFAVQSDSVYLEHIDWALVKQVEGKTHRLAYRLNENGTLSIGGAVGNIVFRETWRKVANYGATSAAD